jgi:hypothetical protein
MTPDVIFDFDGNTLSYLYVLACLGSLWTLPGGWPAENVAPENVVRRIGLHHTETLSYRRDMSAAKPPSEHRAPPVYGFLLWPR